MNPTPPVERRSGAETKETIRAAARALFAERGFVNASVRDIGRAAGVDPALVVRYFGSKDRLFLEVMTMTGALARSIEGPLDGLGLAIVHHLLSGSESTRLVYTALMRAADRPEVREHLAVATTANLVDPIARRLSGPDARLFAALIAAQVTGLLQMLWIVEDPELTSRPIDEVIQLYGAIVQRLVDSNSQRTSDG